MLLYEVIETLDVDMMVQEMISSSIDPHPKTLLQDTQQLKKNGTVPTTIVIPTTIQGRRNNKLLHCLLDTGGSHTIINKRALPNNIQPKITEGNISATTAAGPFYMNQSVTLTRTILPEFSKSFKIDTLQAYIFDSEQCRYDIIFGRDTLEQMKVDVSYSNGTVTWLHHTIDMKTEDFFQSQLNLFYTFQEDDIIDQGESFLKEILPSKYGKVEIDDVILQQKHLNEQQKHDLKRVLSTVDKLFNGKLGCYPHRQIHLDLHSNAIPFHAKAYAVPHIHETIFKKELQRLVEIEVLERCGASEWAAGTFIIPKKDGRVRWITDFRILNNNIIRRKYPLPRIQDILTKRSGYKYFTKIDISMQYYAFMLDEESSDLCTIVTPFGKYRYKRLPMGVKQSPDVAQEIMESCFADMNHKVDVYIDDIGIFSDSWDEHMQTIQEVLRRLNDNGFTVNPLKCEWAVKETDWLGYWLTPTGLKPWSKKVRAILALQRPRNMKEQRSFVGAVSFYRDMWQRRSHILAPLTEDTGSNDFKWNDRKQIAFDQMKAVLAREVLLRYPDHNKPFQIYTDASDFQLGAVIIQDAQPVAYYSRKLTKAQKNYTTMEKELLSIIMTLQEFRSMLLGAEIDIFTDHKNLTYKKLNSQRVLRWRLFMEDYHPTFHYIKGSDNIIADALSRLPFDDEIINDDEQIGPNMVDPIDGFCMEQDNPHLFETLLYHPNINIIPYPIDFARILQHQQQDQQLRQLYQHNIHYKLLQIPDNRQLITYQMDTSQPPRIVIPSTLLEQLIIWYHIILSHPGTTRLFQTIHTNFYHPKLYKSITNITQNCVTCQTYKNTLRGYGHLPTKEITFKPWFNVAVDLIGPWNIKVGQQLFTLDALTMIDTDTNLTEACTIQQKTSQHVAMRFENTWLSRYPKPMRCIHDNGGEFIGHPFQQMLHLHNITDVPTTIKNPQANAICERMHQTVENMLRTLLYHQNQPHNPQECQELVETALASACFALRATIHSTLGVTPGSLAFNRDMLLNIPIIADLQDIQKRRQDLINKNTLRQNQKRHAHTYNINDMILVTIPKPTKLQQRFHGPYKILQVHNNGTITIQRQSNTSERINIRRVKPYYSFQ